MKALTTTTIAIALMLSSCVTGRKTMSDTAPASAKVLPEQTSTSRTNKIWILFFPFGGKSEEKRETQCYNRMIKDTHADGILAQKFVHKKITIPLIVFTYSYKFTTLTGKPFIIKSDSTAVTK